MEDGEVDEVDVLVVVQVDTALAVVIGRYFKRANQAIQGKDTVR